MGFSCLRAPNSIEVWGRFGVGYWCGAAWLRQFVSVVPDGYGLKIRLKRSQFDKRLLINSIINDIKVID
jgi:hypothetical protein